MATGTYTDVTLGDAWADMESRLYDPGHVRWPTDELTIYIQQALRTYNALTNHFRATADFVTASGVALYDLGVVIPTLRAMTYTVAEAVNQICWQLLEPQPTGNLWRGTLQYSLGDILQAIQQARDTFLIETGVVLDLSDLDITLDSTGLVYLPENIINLRRLVYETTDGLKTVLRREDQWGAANYGARYLVTAGRPKAYSISAQPPLIVRLMPTEVATASLNLITVDRGESPSMLGGVLLGVPDDWAWLVVFGALAQLLQRDGLALDPVRASYCDQRWKQGLERARLAPVVISGMVEGATIPLGAVADADAYSAAWPMVPGIPRRIVTAGQTIVGTWPPPGVKPGGGGFTISLDVVRNAPVPVEPDDYIQIGPELVNDLFDYAQHLAAFKEGVGELQATMGLLEQFMGLCGLTLTIQKASQPMEPASVGQTPQDSRTVPYQVPLPGSQG